jgi:DnaK suppressor protein
MLKKVTTSSTPKNTETTTPKGTPHPAKAAAPAKPKPAASPAKPKTPTKATSAAKDAEKASASPAKVASPHKSTSGAKTAAAKSKPASKVVAAKGKGERAAFLASQRQLLLDERANYLRSADVLKAQADSLALEHEPGDVQFDEEGGEGGTSNVDRELDLVLSAQARAAALEIDRALSKIDAGTYGFCEQCGQPIPEARLQALPQAALCVACKSGGLSSRR